MAINNPGTASFYGSDDLNEIMRIFNAKVVSNRQVKIKNPWQFQDNYDIVAALAVPANPGANTKRFYVDPADNHFKMKSTGGSIIDFDTLGTAPTGEVNTASNVGTAGVGFFKQKAGVNLEFKKINTGSNKVTLVDDTANNEVDVDVSEVNLTLQNLGGILTVPKGGTGVGTHTSNGLLKGAGTGNITSIAPGTDGHILTMISGAPAWAAASASADVKTAVFEAGTQIGSLGRRLNFSNANDFTIVENTGADRFDISLNRRFELVASWMDLRGVPQFQNVGTVHRDIFPPAPDGIGFDIDTTGMTDFRFYVSWDKNGGLGTHEIRIIHQTTSVVFTTFTSLVTGRNLQTGVIPAAFLNTIAPIKLQMRAGTATDDPIFRGASLLLK